MLQNVFFLKGLATIDVDRVFFFSNLILEIKKKKDYGSECIMNDGSSFVGFISDKRPALPNGQVGLFLHLACKAITNSAGRLG